MSSTIQYKGYIGSVEFSEEDRILYGKVKGIRSLISCEGSTAEELIHDFHEAVDEYLSFCESSGKSPEMPFIRQLQRQDIPEPAQSSLQSGRGSGNVHESLY